jgi:hypothetical protein
MPIIHKQTITDDLVEYINYFSLLLPDGGYNISKAAWCLWLVDESNVLIIDILMKIINESSQKFDRLQAAKILGSIEPANLLARQTLLQFLSNSNSNYEKDFCFFYSLDILIKMDCAHEIIVEKLLELIEKSKLSDLSSNILEKMSFVTFEEKQQYKIIYKLRLHLSETEPKSVPNYEACHSLLWNCSQSMIYSDFYEGWYHEKISP